MQKDAKNLFVLTSTNVSLVLNLSYFVASHSALALSGDISFERFLLLRTLQVTPVDGFG